jgi:hypothetical protein
MAVGGGDPISTFLLMGSDYPGNIENYAKRIPGLERGTLTKKRDVFGKKLKSVEISGIDSSETRISVNSVVEEFVKNAAPETIATGFKIEWV